MDRAAVAECLQLGESAFFPRRRDLVGRFGLATGLGTTYDGNGHWGPPVVASFPRGHYAGGGVVGARTKPTRSRADQFFKLHNLPISSPARAAFRRNDAAMFLEPD